MNDDRRSRLLGIKLRALVVDHLGDADGDRTGVSVADVEPEPFPSGAAMMVGQGAWVLVDGPAERSLGAALAWALRRSATRLDLVADHDTGVLARRAAGFQLPIDVWFPQERTLLPAVATPLPEPVMPPDEHLALAELIESAGATPNIEHGVVTGEVRGLEVCRVVDEPTVGRLVDEQGVPLAAGLDRPTDAVAGDDGVTLEVGVGANDREAFQLLHGDVPTVDALAEVVRAVRGHRSSGAPGHPLNRMAPERALRAAAIDDPAGVGFVELRPLAPPVPRPSMKDVAPCVAEGVLAGGEARTVVFSTGVDVELAPFVVDVVAMRRDLAAATSGASSAERPGRAVAVPEPVVVVMPERDLLPITRQLLDLVDHPVSVVHPGGA